MARREFQHGMTPRETEMVERYESGQDFATIAAEMGITARVAEATCKYYTTGLAPNRKYSLAMKLGSDALLAAIAEARGPAWCDALIARQRGTA